MNHVEAKLVQAAQRLKRLHTATVFDVLDGMGMPHQCLDLWIKPLDRGMRLAGPAFTIACAADARVDGEYDNDEVAGATFFRRMYRGCVVIVSSGGENRAGHWGELMSLSSQARGAAGLIVDGGVRDGSILMGMAEWPVFTRYLSPIQSRGRTRIRAIEEPIAVAGALSHQVRINPGDWLFGDMDGVVSIPATVVDEVLRKAEALDWREEQMRTEIATGADAAGVFEKHGRL